MAILTRMDAILEKVDRLLTVQHPTESDDNQALDSAIAFTWQRIDGRGRFRAVRHVDLIRLDDLLGIERQLDTLARNTRQFLHGAPANHVLLWGERGCGKSSAVKAVLHAYHRDGLRLIQVHRHDLLDLPEIIERLWERRERYILFYDDLSFEAEDASFKELKALLEGGIQARPENVLVYATSNRRHLLPDRFADRQATITDDEVHPNEAIQEKLSLADRFGLRLGFYQIDQPTYLRIVGHLAQVRALPTDAAALEREALRWAMSAAGRSGRSARQFIDDLEGRLALREE